MSDYINDFMSDISDYISLDAWDRCCDPRLARPIQYRSWHGALLLQRIRDLNDAKMKSFTDGEGMFYGSTPTVRALIGGAIRAFEEEDLSKTERYCRVAERKLLSEARKFRKLKTETERLAFTEANR